MLLDSEFHARISTEMPYYLVYKQRRYWHGTVCIKINRLELLNAVRIKLFSKTS